MVQQLLLLEVQSLYLRLAVPAVVVIAKLPGMEDADLVLHGMVVLQLEELVALEAMEEKMRHRIMYQVVEEVLEEMEQMDQDLYVEAVEQEFLTWEAHMVAVVAVVVLLVAAVVVV